MVVCSFSSCTNRFSKVPGIFGPQPDSNSGLERAGVHHVRKVNCFEVSCQAGSLEDLRASQYDGMTVFGKVDLVAEKRFIRNMCAANC